MTPDLDFNDLRKEFPRNGRPLPVRTARRLGERIASYKMGRLRFWPRPSVEAYKNALTLRP